MSTTPARPPRRAHLPALSGIRIFFAASIVAFHFSDARMWGVLAPLVSNAYVFLGCFFLLSGYILAYNYAERGPTLAKRQFWLARFARLYPVYLLALLVSWHMLLAEFHFRSRTEFLQGVILTPLLLQGFCPLLATFWNTPAWTLSSEVMLYAAFPWIVRLRWPKSPLRLALLTLFFWMLGFIVPGLYILLNPDHLAAAATRFSFGYWLWALKYTPVSYIPTFLAGISLGYLQLRAQISDRARLWMALSATIVLAAVFHWWIQFLPFVMLHTGMMTPLFAILVLGLSGSNWYASALSWRPLVVLGDASFCIYLLHFNTWNLLHLYRIPARLGFTGLADNWFSYAVILAFSLAAYYLLEMPARKWILNRFSHRPKTS